jgi:arylformamidase
MLSTLQFDGHTITFDQEKPIDISIPLDFYGPQPNAYGVEEARAKACEAGDMVGDTRRGGSCNFEQVTLIPHCNGTHTECVGHITHERISVRDCLKDVFLRARLISVGPEPATAASEKYTVQYGDEDQIITADILRKALGENHADALIVRTLPNSEKRSRRYIDKISPFFTNDAIELMVARGIRHLLVDLPSIDRLFDEGRLSNHRIFWNIAPGSFELTRNSRINSTVTELIFVPDSVSDGDYLLNLQIAPFASDAAPSRPVLYSIIEGA